jgi:hypothetical protein
MVLIIIALGLAMIALTGLNVMLDESARVRLQPILQRTRRRPRPYGTQPGRR